MRVGNAFNSVQTVPPNKSLHRTPSSPLSSRQRGAKPAPVSSKPLGDSRRCFLAVMLLLTHASCVSAAFSPKSDVSITCRVKGELAGRTHLSVEVVNVFAGEPPSMLITIRHSGDPDSPPLNQHIDKNLAEFDALPVGRWDLEISIPTSPHSVHCTVNLKENWSCRVRVVFLESKTTAAAA